IADPALPIEALVADPVRTTIELGATSGGTGAPHPAIPRPRDLYAPLRRNSTGLDLADDAVLHDLAGALRASGAHAAVAAPAVDEVREAVDFLRYDASEARRSWGDGAAPAPLGIVACISPWNFPLAIFTGQVAAALAAGNAVIAKPAEQTPLIAAAAVRALHAAGVPPGALQFLPG